MSRLRILTFNIAHGRGLTPIQGLTMGRKLRINLRKIARLIDELKPDVVALQEIDQNSRWAGNFDQLEYLKAHTGFAHSVFGINNRREGLLNLNYGNAFLSRHPILDSENIVFGARTVGEKGFLFVELDIEGRRVPILNLHLNFRSRVHRFRQVERVIRYIAEKHQHEQTEWHIPPIVCGDLNNPLTRPDATAELLRYFSLHGEYSLHPKDGLTFPSPLPSRGLDFVYLPPSCRDISCEIGKTVLSDHCPVWVDFTLA